LKTEITEKTEEESFNNLEHIEIMKKTQVLFSIVLMTIYMSATLNAQDIDVNYYPPKIDAVSAKNYNKGVRNLAYAYAEIEENSSRSIDYVDYWRIAVAYIYMGVDKSTVYSLLLKSKENNKEGFCVILNMQLKEGGENMKKTHFYQFLGEDYLKKLSDCEGVDVELVQSKSNRVFRLKKKTGYFKWFDDKN